MTRRRLGSSLVAGAAGGLIVLCVSAAPAQAKSGISITASPAGSGPGGRIVVAAFGGDDAAGWQRLCVQRLSPRGWGTVECGRAELGTGGWLRTTVPANAHGATWFRALLQRIGRNGRPEPIADLVSAPVGSAAAAPAATPDTAPSPTTTSATPAVTATPAMATPATPAADTPTGDTPTGDTPLTTLNQQNPDTGSAILAVPELLTTFAVPDRAGWAQCAQLQTDSKSTVSLSNVDNGIETASLLRSK